MSRNGWTTALLATTLCAAACESERVVGPGTTDADDVALAQIDAMDGVVDVAHREGSGAGSLFDRLAAAIPGFGGFYFDGSCNLVVVLTRPEQAEHATDILTPLLRRFLQRADRRCPRQAAVIVQKGDFEWQELNRYLGALRPVAQLRGVQRLAISIPKNRIVVGIVDDTIAPKVHEAAHRLGVPPAVLEIVVHRSP